MQLLCPDAAAPARRETFPLLTDPVSYSPDTLDIWSNRPEMDYWLGILGEQVDTIVEKAIASEGNSPGAGPAQAAGQQYMASVCILL